jgi:hypothetical protein
MKKNFLCFILVFIFYFCFVNASQIELTETENDGYILFKYSLNDAKNSRNTKIIKKVEGNVVTYEYKDHVLSCGTHMNGFIKITDNNEKISYEGNFNIDNNPYNITKLSIDFSETKKLPVKRTGILKIDGKDYDVNLFF